MSASSMLDRVKQQIANQQPQFRMPLQPSGSPSDASPSTPSSSGTLTSGTSSGATSDAATETVAQAYLAALAAQGKNTAGDTSPYVVLPSQGSGSSSISLPVVLLVAAVGGAAWWILRKRGE